jgi:hypothetical protein
MVPVVVRAADSRLVLWGMPCCGGAGLEKYSSSRLASSSFSTLSAQNRCAPSGDACPGSPGRRRTRRSAEPPISSGLIAGVSLIGYLYALAASYVHADLFPGISGRSLSVLVSIAVTVVVFLALAVLLGKLSDGQLGMATPLVVPATLLSILIGAVVLLPWLAFIHLFVVPTCKALAWLLNQDRPAHVLRWVAFVLFIVGFHFDLLASRRTYHPVPRGPGFLLPGHAPMLVRWPPARRTCGSGPHPGRESTMSMDLDALVVSGPATAGRCSTTRGRGVTDSRRRRVRWGGRLLPAVAPPVGPSDAAS